MSDLQSNVRDASEVAELEYHQVHRARGRGVWRPLLGSILVAVGVFGVVPVALLLAFGFAGMVGGQSFGDATAQLADVTDPTPAMLAYLMLSLAAGIPVVWLVTLTLHHLRLGWVTSVAGRMRWRYFVHCLGLSVVALFATLVVGALVPTTGSQAALDGLNEFTPTLRAFVVVVVLLVPFQAAAEEYVFRGYLTQACGGLFNHPVVSRTVAVVVPAVLFALAHGAQDPPVFVDRLAFGLVAGVLVLVTGGLEAAIAMHVLNNVVAFGLALAFTDLGTALNPTGGSWWSLPGTLTQSLVYLGLAWWVARARGLRTSAPRPVLASPVRPV